MPFDQMKRREFITLLGGAAVSPLAARAQQPAMPVVGYFHPSTPEAGADLVAAFRKGLSETGYVEGRNVTIEYVWAHNESSRVPELAAELVRRRVSVIVAATLNTALAVKAATTTIPIVFNATGDPVTTGLVASLRRPGGNATGLSSLGGELGAKRLGLLHELVPKAARIALLVNPMSRYAQSMIEETQTAASAIGGQIEAFTADTPREIDAAFASLTQKRAEALVVGLSALFVSRRVQMTTLAAHHRLPTIYALRNFVEAGGLMSYGASYTEQARQIGIYAGRILKGEQPADLPIMQPTKLELVINLKTAKTLGLTIPPGVLAIADEVIE
jgi:putative tryptophan/tyrosine transport system substrate-binding protein